MAITSKSKKILYLQSGGICQNPHCNCDLVRFFESGQVTDIEELAHIIGQSESGPRGAEDMPLTIRDEVDNIICLCPTCHTLIDKNPDEYPIDTLRRWKSEHLDKLKSQFRVPVYSSREELRSAIKTLLRKNKTIFELFGPFSVEANNLLTTANKVWRVKAIDTVIPNNKRVVHLLARNEYLLYEDEKEIAEQFAIHAEEFEYNQISGDKNPYAPIFPQEINNILL